MQDELARGKVVIVAGYQGVSYKREVTTLGRGGSDTTAVALAAALGAEACEIYSDVEGVYTADPRVVPDARRLAELSATRRCRSWPESGARVLNAQAVEFAKEQGIAIYARATRGGGETVVRKLPPRRPDRVVGVGQREGPRARDTPARRGHGRVPRVPRRAGRGRRRSCWSGTAEPASWARS